MHTRVRIFLFLVLMLTIPACFAQGSVTIAVQAGDNDALIDAIHQANGSMVPTFINIEPGPNDETGFVFSETAPGSEAALPSITTQVFIGPSGGLSEVRFETSMGAHQQFRFVQIAGEDPGGLLQLFGCRIEGFGAEMSGSGGAILVSGGGILEAGNCIFSDNLAGGEGGAVAAVDSAALFFEECEFNNNAAAQSGGAISARGSTLTAVRSSFNGNDTELFGCDLNVNMANSSTPNALLQNNNFTDQCGKDSIENPGGLLRLVANTFTVISDMINTTAVVQMLNNLFTYKPLPVLQERIGNGGAEKQVLCEDFDSNALISLGYNIAEDESCFLDTETDQEVLDAGTTLNGDGIAVLLEGSSAIDAGPSEAMVLGEDTLASLPCGYKDILGTARPQDGDGDGEFECDVGAMEVVGGGEFKFGHSGAYFDPLRNGEGTFVENLGNGFATIYTFTYRPDGSGPAWFIGVGEVSGNQVVIDENLRPTGTSFGDGFDADDIELSPAGSMSFIVPDCQVNVPGGVTAFTGEEEIGYEALLVRSVRVSKVVRCVDEAQSVNAGLSGSWFDPARNGEGLIVQWLDFGDVLAIFFTYDENGNQMWMIGQGTPTGKSVTMDALYPAFYTSWGSSFAPGEISLLNWGSFTLNWTECGKMTFSYDSDVGNYGSATRDYIRLSTLAGTECPEFLPVQQD